MTTENSGQSADAGAARPRAGRPAEIARLVTMGTSGVVTFGLVGFFGLSDRQSSPDPGLVTTVPIRPAASVQPSPAAATTPGPTPMLGASAVSLATIVAGATVPSTPAPPVTAAPVPIAAPIVLAAPPPVDAVSEQSR